MSKTETQDPLKVLLESLDFPIDTLPDSSKLGRYVHINEETGQATLDLVLTLFNAWGPIQVHIQPQWLGGPLAGTTGHVGEEMDPEDFGRWQDSMGSEVSVLAKTVALSPWLLEFVLRVANGELSERDKIRSEAELLFTMFAMLPEEGWLETSPTSPDEIPVMPTQGTES